MTFSSCKNISSVAIRKDQSGATLIELMISVFVFAIGVLGYSALQTKSLQATVDNVQREEVVWISDALIGRIRVNNNAAARLVYANLLTDLSVCPAQPLTICADTNGAGASDCTAAEMATFDVWDELCNNPAGGLQAVQGLTIDLDDDGTDLTLTSTWCSKAIEGEVAAAGAGTCSNAIAEQSYELVFRP